MAIATRLSFLGLVAIISGKNLYKSGRDTSLMSSVLAMISTEITMIMTIHVTFGSIVYGLLNRLSVQYPLPIYIYISCAYLHLIHTFQSLFLCLERTRFRHAGNMPE